MSTLTHDFEDRIDPDFMRKQRIKVWVLENCPPQLTMEIYPFSKRFEGIENMLLQFEKFLILCEEKRQSC